MISNLDLPPLPPRKTVEDVFVDYLGYVKQEIKKFIEDSYGDGHAIWTTLYPHMAVILTTPNGWEGRQQTRMREAAVRAELVDASGKQRIKFVTEAEVRVHLRTITGIIDSFPQAAVLYAADSGSINNWLVVRIMYPSRADDCLIVIVQEGERIILCDCGGKFHSL